MIKKTSFLVVVVPVIVVAAVVLVSASIPAVLALLGTEIKVALNVILVVLLELVIVVVQ